MLILCCRRRRISRVDSHFQLLVASCMGREVSYCWRSLSKNNTVPDCECESLPLSLILLLLPLVSLWFSILVVVDVVVDGQRNQSPIRSATPLVYPTWIEKRIYTKFLWSKRREYYDHHHEFWFGWSLWSVPAAFLIFRLLVVLLTQ